jgi:hypothetical protein
LATGAIIAIAVGVVVLTVAAIFLCVYMRRRHRRFSGKPGPQPRSTEILEQNGTTDMAEVEANDPLPELTSETSREHELDTDARSVTRSVSLYQSVRSYGME